MPIDTTDRRGRVIQGRLAAWGKLLLGVFAIWFFMFGAGPWLRHQIPEAQKLSDFIDATGMSSNVIWYTEVDDIVRAERNARAAVAYGPVHASR